MLTKTSLVAITATLLGTATAAIAVERDEMPGYCSREAATKFDVARERIDVEGPVNEEDGLIRVFGSYGDNDFVCRFRFGEFEGVHRE